MKILNRIKKNEDFQKIIKSKRFIKSDEFVVYYQKSEFEYLRIGISTSKKLGGAVTRNKIRRQVRSMCGELCDFNQSLDIIIIVRHNYLNNSFNNNQEKLLILLRKVSEAVNEEKH